jgi:hypothetical protein
MKKLLLFGSFILFALAVFVVGKSEIAETVPIWGNRSINLAETVPIWGDSIHFEAEYVSSTTNLM